MHNYRSNVEHHNKEHHNKEHHSRHHVYPPKNTEKHYSGHHVYPPKNTEKHHKARVGTNPHHNSFSGTHPPLTPPHCDGYYQQCWSQSDCDTIPLAPGNRIVCLDHWQGADYLQCVPDFEQHTCGDGCISDLLECCNGVGYDPSVYGCCNKDIYNLKDLDCCCDCSTCPKPTA